MISDGEDLKEMPDLGSIAENDSDIHLPPLPPPWEEYYSDNYRIPYYYNTETGESSWERPIASALSEFAPPPPSHDPINSSPKINGSVHVRGETSQVDSLPSRDGKADIAQRSKLLLEAKKKREEALRQQREDQERQQIVGAPQITKKSQKLNRNVDTMLAWNEEKQKRLEEKQRTIAALAQAEHTGKPTLVSKQSAKILEQSARYDDELTVEERLLEYEEKKRLKQIARIQEENLKARQAASQTTRSHGNGGTSRLYDQAASRRVAKEQQMAISKQKEMQAMFQPKINKTSAKIAQRSRPAAPIEDILNDQGKRYQHNAEIRKQRSDIKEQIQRNSRKLNPTSERILQSRGEAGGVERLLKPTGNVRMSTIYSMDLPTFRPQLSTNHVPSQPAGDIYTKSQKWLQDKEKRLQQQRLQYEEEQMQECSFTPFAACDGTVVSGGSGGSGGLGSSGSGVLERTLEWQRKRERDIERIRTEQLESELKECSFAPKRVTANKYTNVPARAPPPPQHVPQQYMPPPPPPRPGHFSQPAIASLYQDLHSNEDDDSSPYSSPYGQPALPIDEEDVGYDGYHEQFDQLDFNSYDISELDIDGFDECGPPPSEPEISFDML